MIGDPSGRNEMRKPMTREEVQKNAKTYEQQVFKILDQKKTVVDFNSRWLMKMSAAELIELSSHYTVARMLERDDFQKRYRGEEPISIREFLYPIAQGYDSVALKADVELGGTDQIFNLLVGRELQRARGQEPQVVLTMPLMEGLDGVQKMSKSLNNYVGIAESAKEMFGKIMSVSDDLMMKYFDLLTDVSSQTVKGMHPREAKARLACEIVSRYHGEAAGKKARSDFDQQFKEKGAPKDRPRIAAPEAGLAWPQYLKGAGLVKSSSEASRLISQGGVKVYSGGNPATPKTIKGVKEKIELQPGDLIKVGKRTWAEVE